MKAHGISTDLVAKVKQFIRRVCIEDIVSANKEDMVLSILPLHLKRKVLREVRGPTLHGHALFRALEDSHAHCYEHLCCGVFRPLVYPPDTEVFSCTERCSRFFFTINA